MKRFTDEVLPDYSLKARMKDMPKVDDTMSLLTAINCIVVIAEG